MRASAALLLCTTVACTPSSFGPNGYAHPKEQYRIVDSSPEILGPDWILDSHYGEASDVQPKQGLEYEVRYEIDADGDGETDFESDLPRYDVRWLHAVDSSVIWIRTLPIPGNYFQKDAKVLLTNYVERIAGSGVEAATYDRTLIAKSTRYGTKILSSEAVTLGKEPAHAVDIEIVNLDQLEMDESAPRHRASLVLAHSLTWLPVGHTQNNSVVLAVYLARPEDYPKHLHEFHHLLSKVDLGNGTSPFHAPKQRPDGDDH